MISTRILKPAAPSDGRNNCVATTRRSANAWNGIVRFFSAFPQSPTTPATSARGGSFAVAGALSRHRLLRPHTVRPLRGAGPRLCPRGGHQLRRRGDCGTRVHTSKRTSSSIRCTICPCWSKRPTRWKGGSLGRPLPPVFGDLRRLLEARMGKAGKREYVQVLRLIESFSLDDVRAAISEALERGVIGFDAVKHLVLCRIEKRPPRLTCWPIPICRAPRWQQPRPARTWGS